MHSSRRFSQHPKLGLRSVARCDPLDLWPVTRRTGIEPKPFFWQIARSEAFADLEQWDLSFQCTSPRGARTQDIRVDAMDHYYAIFSR